jgi:hypothetical protein
VGGVILGGVEGWEQHRVWGLEAGKGGRRGGCAKAQGDLLFTVASKVCLWGLFGGGGQAAAQGGHRGLPLGTGQPAAHCGQQSVSRVTIRKPSQHKRVKLCVCVVVRGAGGGAAAAAQGCPKAQVDLLFPVASKVWAWGGVG